MLTLLKMGREPFYLLIDKNGIIQEKGSHIMPGAVREKIAKLL